jgi:hypothetical protein
VRVHSFTFSFTPKLPSWFATLQAFALVASPRLGLGQLGEETTFRGLQKETNFQYLKFNGTLSGSIVQNAHKSELNHKILDASTHLNPKQTLITNTPKPYGKKMLQHM